MHTNALLAAMLGTAALVDKQPHSFFTIKRRLTLFGFLTPLSFIPAAAGARGIFARLGSSHWHPGIALCTSIKPNSAFNDLVV